MKTKHIVAAFPQYKDENGDPIVSDDHETITDQTVSDFCNEFNVDKDKCFIVTVDEAERNG